MSRTILLADDSVTIQKVIELTFMDEDFEVVAVGNGDDALEQLDEITPDFVIADVHMPGANGYDVAKHSKSLRPEVPVLLLVGTFEPFDEEQAEKSGCDAYLKKPFDSQELQRLVEELSAEAARDAGPLEATGWRAESPLATGESVGVAPAAAPIEPIEPIESIEPAETSPAVESTPFSIGLEDDDEPAPTRVEPPPPPEEPAFDLSVGAPDEGASDAGVLEMGGDDEPWGAAQAQSGARTEAPAPAQEPAFELEPSSVSAEPEAPEPEAEEESAPGGAPLEELRAEEDDRPAGPLSDEDVDRIARRIIELLGDRAIRDVAWEVVPDLAEVVIRGRLRELENQVESVE